MSASSSENGQLWHDLPQTPHELPLDRGLVDALVDRIQREIPGAVISNRNRVDVLAVRGRRRILAEIKTDGSTTSIHAGVGQLMVYGLATKPSERWLILPAESVDRGKSLLDELGITVVGYRGSGRDITVAKLPD